MDPQYDIRESAEADIRVRRKMRAKLEGVHIRRSDDEGVATVTITGSGHILDLQLAEEAMRYPTRVGRQVTVAVTRARRAATTLAERYRDAKLPRTSSAAEIESALPQPSNEIDVSSLEWAGSADNKRILVEALDAFNQALRAHERFKKEKLKQKIGVAAGQVEIDIASKCICVTISPDAPQNVGLERLSTQALDAIRLAEQRAARLRQEVLDQIWVNGTSIGERIRSAKTRLEGNGQ